MGRQLSHEAFKRRLSDSVFHVSDATIDYLLRGQSVSSIDMDTVCWRTAKRTILKILHLKWSLLMKIFRSRDLNRTRRLSKETMKEVLGRADVGMSTSLVEILIQNANEEDDGKIDYDLLLSGKLKRETFNIEVYVAYKTVESEWERLSQHFWEFDLNGDGRVNHEEFKVALRQLKHPALTDPAVIEGLVKHLDPTGDPNKNPPTDNIDFDKFSWDMALSEIKSLVESRGDDMRLAFQQEATREFRKYQGKLPRDKAIRAIHRGLADDQVKIVLIKIIIRRAEAPSGTSAGSNSTAAANQTRLISEADLTAALRGIAGSGFDTAEQESLRQNFMVILEASKVDTMDRWCLMGEEEAEPKKFSGAASLGPDATRQVGPVPLKRLHMNFFLGRGGQNLLASMKASPALVKIKEDREKTIYSRAPWITFWQNRANFRSPAMQMQGTETSAASRTRPAASVPTSAPPVANGPPSVSLGADSGLKGQGGLDRAWEVVRTKVRKAAFENFQTNEEALAAFDPSNPGAGAIATATLLQAVQSMGAHLTSSEREILSEKMDPGRDGMVLKSDISRALLPPAQNRSALERLAQERHARGIYTRLRNRNTQLAPTASEGATAISTQGPGGNRAAQGDNMGGFDADHVDYHYRHAWSRVEHPSVGTRQSHLSSHYGAIAARAYQQTDDANNSSEAWEYSSAGAAVPAFGSPATRFSGYSSSSFGQAMRADVAYGARGSRAPMSMTASARQGISEGLGSGSDPRDRYDNLLPRGPLRTPEGLQLPSSW